MTALRLRMRRSVGGVRGKRRGVVYIVALALGLVAILDTAVAHLVGPALATTVVGRLIAVAVVVVTVGAVAVAVVVGVAALAVGTAIGTCGGKVINKI